MLFEEINDFPPPPPRTPPQIKLFTRRHFLDHINKYPPRLLARELSFVIDGHNLQALAVT